MHVRLKPNYSSSPHVLMAVLGLMAGVSILISLMFWGMGAPLILPFALIESVLLGVAFVCYARTRSDFDEITLSDRHLIVRQERRGQTKEHQFTRGLFRVSMTDEPSSLVRVTESGRCVELGEWLLPHERLLLCQRLADAPMASNLGTREAL